MGPNFEGRGLFSGEHLPMLVIERKMKKKKDRFLVFSHQRGGKGGGLVKAGGGDELSCRREISLNRGEMKGEIQTEGRSLNTAGKKKAQPNNIKGFQ